MVFQCVTSVLRGKSGRTPGIVNPAPSCLPTCLGGAVLTPWNPVLLAQETVLPIWEAALLACGPAVAPGT